jgi:CRP-like cAMP-binding protein
MQDGTEVTSHFYFAPTLVADLTSDRMKVNARLNVQALEDAKMYITDFEKVEKLALERPTIMLLFLRFVEHLYIFASNRQLSFLFDTPVERYKNLFKERPKVVANIPLQYIASYLGINPETLSRIRKKLSQEGQ